MKAFFFSLLYASYCVWVVIFLLPKFVEHIAFTVLKSFLSMNSMKTLAQY